MTHDLHQLAARGPPMVSCDSCGAPTRSHALVSWCDHVEILDDAEAAISAAQDVATGDEVEIGVMIACHTCVEAADLPLDGAAAREFVEGCADE